ASASRRCEHGRRGLKGRFAGPTFDASGSAFMPDVVRNRSVPQITVSNADYERLTDLANASLQRQPAVARELLEEMDRAKVVDAAAVPANVVRMGSTVPFPSDDGHPRTLTLVYPADES